MRQLFLDCDGVMADFDSYFETSFGHPSRNFEEKHGANKFWENLQNHDDFYNRLPLMPDAMELFNAVKHLNPTILTGLPNGDWAEPQKRTWGARHFPQTTMICCLSKNKRDHMKPGDVLVDDWLRYRDLWVDAGGIFIHHTSAEKTLILLREYFDFE